MREIPFDLKDYTLFIESADFPLEAKKRISRLRDGGVRICFLPTVALEEAESAESQANRFHYSKLDKVGVNHVFMPNCEFYEMGGEA